MEKEEKILLEKTPKGNHRGDSMKHKHKFILDKNSFGICECGATKQYPIERKPKLTDFEKKIAEGLETSYVRGDWLQERNPAINF